MGTGRKINLKDRIAKFLGFTSKAYEQFDAPSDKNLAGTKQRFWSKRSSPVSTSNNHASNSVPVGRSKGGQSDSTSSGEQANARAGSTSFPSSNSTNRDARAALPDVRGLDSNALAQLSPEQRDRALQELVSLLSQGSAEQRAQAAEALFNSTSEDELARQKISALGVVEPLVDLLRQGSDQGQMYAAYTLSALTSIDMSRTDMREHGAIPALIEILQHSTFLVAKKGAMRALGRLARNDDAAMEIVKTGGVPAIVALLQSDDLSLIRRCLIALYFIGADKEPLQAEIAKAGAVPVLVQLCKSDNAEVQAEAADVLKVLARNPECAQLIWRCGGNEALQHVAEHGLHPKSKHCAVKALQRLGEVEEYRQQIIRTGGTAFLEMNPESNEVEQLADIVSRGDPWVRAQAAQAIAEVSDDDPRISKYDVGIVGRKATARCGAGGRGGTGSDRSGHGAGRGAGIWRLRAC